jgi:UDP-galactopyranose mutase
MIKKKIVIVGGGITGCVLSLILKKNGHSVEIYEIKKKIGGILGDFEKDGHKFLRGCQYLNYNGYAASILKNFSKNLKKIKNRYGVYMNFSNKDKFSQNYAVPIFDIKNSYFNKKITNQKKINLYPLLIKKNLNNFFKNIKINPINMIYETYSNFQMRRIGIPNLEDELLRLKKKCKLHDDLYAVDRNKLGIKNTLYSLIPKNGFDYFFSNFENSANIKINKSCNIIPKWNKNKLEIFVKEKKIQGDYIIWTANPTNLIQNYLNVKLDSYPFKTVQVSANLSNKNLRESFFQIYSDKINILRIFLYKISNLTKINIECFKNEEKIDEYKIFQQTKQILSKLNINIRNNSDKFFSFLDTRFNLITIRDKKIIKKFNKKTLKTNLINSPWLLYGRDNKLNFYVKRLIEKKLINQ